MFLPVKNNDLRVIIKAEDPLNTGIFPDSVFCDATRGAPMFPADNHQYANIKRYIII